MASDLRLGRAGAPAPGDALTRFGAFLVDKGIVASVEFLSDLMDKGDSVYLSGGVLCQTRVPHRRTELASNPMTAAEVDMVGRCGLLLLLCLRSIPRHHVFLGVASLRLRAMSHASSSAPIGDLEVAAAQPLRRLIRLATQRRYLMRPSGVLPPSLGAQANCGNWPNQGRSATSSLAQPLHPLWPAHCCLRL